MLSLKPRDQSIARIWIWIFPPSDCNNKSRDYSNPKSKHEKIRQPKFQIKKPEARKEKFKYESPHHDHEVNEEHSIS